MASISTHLANSLNPFSSGTTRPKFDVFLSFRGEDVRDNFLEYVYRGLRQKGILTFKDDDKLKDGEDIKDGLYEAIEESSFSIVILTINYASSSWCLEELAHILHCKRTSGHVVYPIFYHVEPTQVRKIEGKFGEGFAKAASTNEGKVAKWTLALNEVANLKGWAYPNTRFQNEAALIDNLVHEIFIRSIDTYPIHTADLVGIRSRMVEVIKLLDLGSNETRVVGLWGMGGIGKTTLAKVVYDSISWQFDGCSFIDNVTELLQRSGVLALQEHLISDILKEKDFEVRSVMRGTSIIQNMVSRIKVLIVFDDVSEPKQLENLVGELPLFSPGSRIIITTRNQHVLTVCRAHDVFNVKELKRREAIELFKSKAFAKNRDSEEFPRLIDRAVQYANGVPLALKVLGSFLLGASVLEWECALDRLRKSPDDEIQRVLRISYDGLHWTEKDIFLDIACFFRGTDKDRVIKILDSCGFNPASGINVLVKKSLLTISVDNNLWMHDLVQTMGLSIVDEESRKEPGERSRLWRPSDVKDVLLENTGTKKVEGLIFYPENITPRPDAFAKMTSLRVLMIHDAWCSIDLPNKLRVLLWHRYPLKCMPSAFQPEHLVELCLTNSHIEHLWDRKVVLPKLTLLDLRHSTSLTKGPDLTGFPNLENLVFEGCTALVDLHPSIKYLRRLKNLNLKGCSILCSIPYGIESQCLETLIFSGCSKLNNILESFGDLKRLSQLNLRGTGITKLPQSIGNSTNLYHLDLSSCINLKSIPSSIGQLKKLNQLLLNGCSSLNKLPDEIGHLESLEILDVSFFGFIPDSIVPGSTSSQTGQLETLKQSLFKKLDSLRNKNKAVGLVDGSASFPGISKTSSIIVQTKERQQLLLSWYDSFRKFPDEVEEIDDASFSGCTSINIGQLNLIRKFKLNGYHSLNKLHAELGNNYGLEFLDISYSGVLPDTAFSQALGIPSSIGQLKNLKQLLLIGCCNLRKLPEEVGLMDSLEILDLSFSGVKKLPTSVANLRNLQTLNCKGCKSVENLDELLLLGLKSLTMLDLTLCGLKSIPESIGLCFSLKTLLLSENYFQSLPASIKNLSNLERLYIDDCKSLQELPELPSNTRDVLAFGCESLKTICSPTVYKDARRLWFAGCPKLVGNEELSIIMGYNFLFNQIMENKRRSSRVYTGPGSKIPEWINIRNVGGLVKLPLPIHDFNESNLLGFAFSAVVVTENRKRKIGVHMRIGEKFFNFGDFYRYSANSKNVIIMFYPIRYFTVDEIHKGGTVLEFCFVTAQYPEKRGFFTSDQALKPAMEVKECGACLMYKNEVIKSVEIVEPLSLENEVTKSVEIVEPLNLVTRSTLDKDKAVCRLGCRPKRRSVKKRRQKEKEKLQNNVVLDRVVTILVFLFLFLFIYFVYCHFFAG